MIPANTSSPASFIYTPANCPDHNQDLTWGCTCMVAARKQELKDKRDRAVTAVTNALRKHQVSHQDSGIANVVLITLPGMPKVYLSLKSQRDDSGHVVYKYRVADTLQWRTQRRDAFFMWLTQASKPLKASGFIPLETMPIGKFKGRSIMELVQQERSYLTWLYSAANNLHQDLRRTLNVYLGGDGA